MNNGYIRFRQDDAERLSALKRVVTSMADAKTSKMWPNDERWLPYFDSECMKHFWQPTEQEKKKWLDKWTKAPYPDKLTDPDLQTPWDFGSMLDAIHAGEYVIHGIQKNPDGSYDLTFEAFSYPYGGIDALTALVEAFDCILIGTEDGTGYRKKY